MTPDLLARILAFWQSELIVLSTAIGKDMNAALGANISLSDPEVAWRLVVRDHVDRATCALGLALLYAREPHVAGQLIHADTSDDGTRGAAKSSDQQEAQP